MSRVQALALALVAAVVAFAAGRVLGAEDQPEPPAPIVVDSPGTGPGTSTNPGGPGSSTTRPTGPPTTGRAPATSDPAIVPTPTVGPTSPPGDDDADDGDDDADDGGGSSDDDGGDDD